MIKLLEQIAKIKSDGHFTIMRFTGNWRVAFYTSEDREMIDEMFDGSTLEEAAGKAIINLLILGKEKNKMYSLKDFINEAKNA